MYKICILFLCESGIKKVLVKEMFEAMLLYDDLIMGALDNIKILSPGMMEEWKSGCQFTSLVRLAPHSLM